jgi:pimeloyl-ACP methyl ester carboxylesterase
MPYINSDDGVRLHYVEAGEGEPLVFVHEFLGDSRGWIPQLRHFSRYYRCIAFNARGYPPSDVPSAVESYGQRRAADDILSVLAGLEIERAHLVGFSMGSYAVLHFGLEYPERSRSLVVAGGGYGSDPTWKDRARAEFERTAQDLERLGVATMAEGLALGPARVQFQNKDPLGWGEFRDHLSGLSSLGLAMTLRGVQIRRPGLWELEERLARMTLPVLLISGDEDEPSLEGSLFMKRLMPGAALVILPRSGHTVNQEEPHLFNRALQDFLHAVENGRWGVRDPRSRAPSITGDRD